MPLASVNNTFNTTFNTLREEEEKQAGAELCQAQFKLGLPKSALTTIQ